MGNIMYSSLYLGGYIISNYREYDIESKEINRDKIIEELSNKQGYVIYRFFVKDLTPVWHAGIIIDGNKVIDFGGDDDINKVREITITDFIMNSDDIIIFLPKNIRVLKKQAIIKAKEYLNKKNDPHSLDDIRRSSLKNIGSYELLYNNCENFVWNHIYNDNYFMTQSKKLKKIVDILYTSKLNQLLPDKDEIIEFHRRYEALHLKIIKPLNINQSYIQNEINKMFRY